MFDDWGRYSFGFLDLRKMAAGETLTTEIDVRVDGFWVAPCDGETTATTVVSRVEWYGSWKPEDGSVFCVEEGATLRMDAPLKPTTDDNVLRKTGDGGLVLRNALGGSRVDVQVGTCEFLFGSDNITSRAAANRTRLPSGSRWRRRTSCRSSRNGRSASSAILWRRSARRWGFEILTMDSSNSTAVVSRREGQSLRERWRTARGIMWRLSSTAWRV